MTKRQFAEDFVDKYYYSDNKLNYQDAIKTCLYFVDEIIEVLKYNPQLREYWTDIKQEIEKL